MAIPSAAFYLPLTPNLPPSISLSSSKSSFIASSCSLSRPSNRVLVARTRPGNVRLKRFSCSCIFGLGVPELVVIAGVAALVFGPKQLPEVGRSIGKTVKSFQQAAKEFESELKKEPESEDEAAKTEPAAVRGGDQENATAVSEGTKDSVMNFM